VETMGCCGWRRRRRSTAVLWSCSAYWRGRSPPATGGGRRWHTGGILGWCCSVFEHSLYPDEGARFLEPLVTREEARASSTIQCSSMIQCSSKLPSLCHRLTQGYRALRGYGVAF
jgi:hypothetical protein